MKQIFVTGFPRVLQNLEMLENQIIDFQAWESPWNLIELKQALLLQSFKKFSCILLLISQAWNFDRRTKTSIASAIV